MPIDGTATPFLRAKEIAGPVEPEVTSGSVEP